MVEIKSYWPEQGYIPKLSDFTENNGELSCGPYILRQTEHGWSAIYCMAEKSRYEKKLISENNSTSTKALAALQRYLENGKKAPESKKEDELYQEYVEYSKTHSIQNARSSFITCSTCRSMLNKRLLSSNRCPLCGNDLRPKSVLNKLTQYRNKLAPNIASA